MTQDELMALTGQYFKEGLVLLIVENGSTAWLNHTTYNEAITEGDGESFRHMARVIRNTAIKGGKIATLAVRTVAGYSKLETEADVVVTVGFNIDRFPDQKSLVIRKWRSHDAIPSPGVWPLTK